MDYIPTTDEDKEEMLKQIGVKSIKDLTSGLRPAFQDKIHLSSPMSELELVNHMKRLSLKNKPTKYFVGAGSYNHYIPAAVSHLIQRGEFLTGYTPYQPEMSQGTLQAMYEFQSYICLLTGMDIANGSLYDGSSALAEAVLLSCSYNGKNSIFIKSGLNPEYFRVLKTYCDGADLTIANEITEDTACIIAQNPDFYGNIENLQFLAEKAHNAGALFIVCVVEPTSLAVLKAPGDYGADVVVGDGQSFGIPLNFGGPYLGFIAVKSFLLKKIPGRICGMTTDSKGNQGFVLTYQAREQHIRRERATSNITTNVALMAIAATIYLSLMGRDGLRAVATLSYKRAHLLYDRLKVTGLKPLNSKPFYNEFVLQAPPGVGTRILSNLLQNGILGGLDLGEDKMLMCCTETNQVEDIVSYASIVKETISRK
ncbi:MAG TPA: aminomethyl-transferring glycine dehydrogenase subunit GcvPA [Nitrososphaeraceae archaeon]|nr:aminomethyl-transferring glycine dehydrogenase subunit GcvPA [Nitrososphaeraceae archaeon]